MFEATSNTNLNTTSLIAANPKQDLRIGLVDGALTGGSGFQSLVFKITESNYGVSSSTQTYTFNSSNGGLAAAQTFFHGRCHRPGDPAVHH